MAGSFHHRPVLLRESIEGLALRPGSRVVDGTLGGGGHAAAILERIGPTGRFVGLDHDAEALATAATRLARFGDRVQLVRASFRELRSVLRRLDVDQVDAVLLDLGVSSWQIDAPDRGFRFSEETADVTPLDMRMDQRLENTAADLLATAPPGVIERWLREYGELPGAARLARAIDEARRVAPLRSVRRPAARDRRGPRRRRAPSPSGDAGLPGAAHRRERRARRARGGPRRRARRARAGRAPRRDRLPLARGPPREAALPRGGARLRVPAAPARLHLRPPAARCASSTRRAVVASEAEQRENPRSRSARLRIAERLSLQEAA